MKSEIENIVARLNVVFDESTLGDIPFIIADLRKIAEDEDEAYANLYTQLHDY